MLSQCLADFPQVRELASESSDCLKTLTVRGALPGQPRFRGLFECFDDFGLKRIGLLPFGLTKEDTELE